MSALALALAAAVAAAPPIHLERADLLEHEVETGRSVASGSVRIRRADLVLEADRATLVGTRLEAEGNVRITQGEDILTGTRATYEMRTGAGTIDRARGFWGGVHVAADRLIVTETQAAIAEGGLLSPCAIGTPFGPSFRARRFEILRGQRIRARFLRVQVGPVPILFFPALSMPAPTGLGFPGARTAPSMRLAVGRGDFDGVFAKTGVEYEMGSYGQGLFRVDYRTRVGWALGLDHRIAFPAGRGDLFTEAYWADVRDGRDRHRLRVRYLGDVTDRLHLRAQAHRVSDRLFLRDFFVREFLEEEPPANDVTLTYRGDAWVGRLSWIGNPNRDEVPEAEYLPEAEVRWMPRRLPGGFVAEGEASIARIGTDDGRTDTEFTRGRGRARLSRPTPLDGFVATPFIAADVARYTRDERIGGGGGTRTLPSVGATLETLLVGRWGDRWRHILRPAVTFEHIERRGLAPDPIIVRDPDDRLRDGDVVSIDLDSKFVRRRRDGSAHRLGKILLSTFYDPDRRPHRWGDIRAVARLSPTPRVAFSLEAAYDPNVNLVARSDAALSYASDSWSASATLHRSNGRVRENDQLQIGGNVEGWVTGAWWGRLGFAFDAKEGRLDSARYHLTRRGACWTVGLGFEDQRLLDRQTYFFTLGLTPFGRPAEVSVGGY